MQSLTVTVRDAFDNPVSDYAGTIRFASSDVRPRPFRTRRSAPRIAASRWSPRNSAPPVRSRCSPATCDAVDRGLRFHAGDSRPGGVPGPRRHPPATLSGAPLTVTVTAVDNHGNLAADFTGTVHFASTDPEGRAARRLRLHGADLGSHTFAVVLTSSGTSTVVSPPRVSRVLATSPSTRPARRRSSSRACRPRSRGRDPEHHGPRAPRRWGNAVTDYAGTLRFANTDREASPIPDLGVPPADLGTKVVTVQFRHGGTQTLSASKHAHSFHLGGGTTRSCMARGAPRAHGIPPSTVRARR